MEEAASRDSVTTEVRVLGGFAITVDGATVTPSGHPAAVVKHLAIADGPLHVEELADRLWPEAAASVGRARLRNVLARLRDQAAGVVVRDGETLRFGEDVRVDARELERAVRVASATVRDAPARARAVLEASPLLDLGDLLPSDPYVPGFARPRDRVRRTRTTGLDLLARACEQLGDIDAAVAASDLAIELEPEDEDRYIRAIDLRVRHDRRAAARQVLRRALVALEGLELEPSADLDARRETLRL